MQLRDAAPNQASGCKTPLLLMISWEESSRQYREFSQSMTSTCRKGSPKISYISLFQQATLIGFMVDISNYLDGTLKL